MHASCGDKSEQGVYVVGGGGGAGGHLVLLQKAEPFAGLRLVPFFMRFALRSIAPGGHTGIN